MYSNVIVSWMCALQTPVAVGTNTVGPMQVPSTPSGNDVHAWTMPSVWVVDLSVVGLGVVVLCVVTVVGLGVSHGKSVRVSSGGIQGDTVMVRVLFQSHSSIACSSAVAVTDDLAGVPATGHFAILWPARVEQALSRSLAAGIATSDAAPDVTAVVEGEDWTVLGVNAAVPRTRQARIATAQ